MESDLPNFWVKTIHKLTGLTLFDYKKKVKKITEQCVKEYLKSKKINYRSIELITIRDGMNYRAYDGGSFLVKVNFNNNPPLKLFVKRNTKLKWFCLARPPFKFKGTSHLKDHNYHLHKFIFQQGIKVPRPLFFCKNRRIIITEYIKDLPLKKALKNDCDKTTEIFKRAGRHLGKLHLLNITYRKLKPQHTFINLKSENITFIDCELLTKTGSINDFSNDLRYLSEQLFYSLPKKKALDLYRKVIEGYKEVVNQKTYKEVLFILKKEVKKITRIYLIKKFTFNLILFLNDSLNRISRGYIRI